MIRILHCSPDQPLRTDLTVADLPAALREEKSLIWVDFEATPPSQAEPVMREVFGFHPLAIEDALQQSHVPKLDDWGHYLYIVLHIVTFKPDQEGGELDTLEVDFFLGNNYVVTYHDHPVSSLERAWSLIQRDERHLSFGTDYLMYRMTDEIVASYMPVVEAIDEAIDQAEDEIFSNPNSATLQRIFLLKRSALHLRRIIGPQREVLNKLARDEFAVIDPHERVYFRDVYDHLVRLHDIIESIRDLVGGALDMYLSVVNNRMNDIMKTLTLITTLFMPISFIVGFFGMNFFQPVADRLREWTGMPAFLITIGIILLTPIGMYILMRNLGWMKSTSNDEGP